jgi:hypothetical protein
MVRPTVLFLIVNRLRHNPARSRLSIKYRKLLPLLFAVCLGVQAQATLTVDQLVSFVRSAIQRKQDDREVATYLLKAHLSNRLEDQTIEELQTLGAGAKTVAALRVLRDSSARLSVASSPPPPTEVKPLPSPSAAEQKKVLAEATEYALNYEKNLPNFICTQVTRRFEDPAGGGFRALDTINERLSYFDHHEDYKVTMVNNKPVEMEHDKLNGATSSGEFGSIMREIFATQTQTTFAWDRWATLRERRMHVYNYRVLLANSGYHIILHDQSLNIVVGYHGLIYVDADQHLVHRITLEAENIPASFPVQDLKLRLDYGLQKIGESEYLLPLQFEIQSREGRIVAKNDVDYHFYRKFGTDSTIKFDTPDPIPDDKIKEKPPVKKP